MTTVPPVQRIIPYLFYADAPRALDFLRRVFGFRRARDGGATIVSEPNDEHGTRSYRAMDPEGHRWIFATPLDGADR